MDPRDVRVGAWHLMGSASTPVMVVDANVRGTRFRATWVDEAGRRRGRVDPASLRPFPGAVARACPGVMKALDGTPVEIGIVELEPYAGALGPGSRPDAVLAEARRPGRRIIAAGACVCVLAPPRRDGAPGIADA